ncbi:SPOR domain-containing protein [Corynebacterium sp.]|uniref:SPOR domain-containing protein n=1 Tax=Corynebacterium sp. TaxID=1720 RepID=UPI0025BDE581|nr:SPOR domain-containing protein [Corynebacterium sp.]
MSEQQWYFDTASGEVTQGKSSGWDSRMGPYDSREAAEHALQIARERTKAADEWDED